MHTDSDTNSRPYTYAARPIVSHNNWQDMAPPAGRCDHAAAASRRRSARLAALRTLPAPPTAVAPPAPRTTTTPCRRRRRLPLHFRRSDNQACLVSNLAHHQVVFVEAWPGTGRSSQVPRVLHAAGHGPVVCSQTYRIAAESAAAHAATNMRAGEVGCMVAAPPEDQASGTAAPPARRRPAPRSLRRRRGGRGGRRHAAHGRRAQLRQGRRGPAPGAPAGHLHTRHHVLRRGRHQ